MPGSDLFMPRLQSWTGNQHSSEEMKEYYINDPHII